MGMVLSAVGVQYILNGRKETLPVAALTMNRKRSYSL